LKPRQNRFRRNAVRIALGLAVMAVVLLQVTGVLRLDFVQRLENYTYDLRLQATLPGGVDPRVVIVDLDERSLRQEGHWPWGRDKMARLVDQLFDAYHIRVLGFDMVLAEPDTSSGLQNLQALAGGALKDVPQFQAALHKLTPQLQFDERFARSLQGRPVVLGYYFQHGLRSAGQPQGALPAPAIARDALGADKVGAAVAEGYTANLPVLQHAAAGGGFFNATPLVDPDGVFRRVSLLQSYDGALYESLSLAVTKLATKTDKVGLVYADDTRESVALEALRLGARRIPVDADVAALVPFRGRQGSFPYVSATDVLSGKADAKVLQSAIVLVGTTAPGLLDLRTTPVQEAYAGVEVHANLVAGILDGNIMERPPYVLGLEVLMIFVVGVLLAVALPMLSPMRATLLTLATFMAMFAINLWEWKADGLILPLATSVLVISALYVLNVTFGFFVDSRAKRLLARLFGQYVPPELVEEMAEDPGAYTLAGESRELSVLFSDVRGFTSISEGLDPRELTHLMNEYLTPMTRVIHGHRGTIDKYMGDAIMAFWGAPVSDPQHASHAVAAALDMMQALYNLQEPFAARGWPPIRIGVGINTGDMTVGNMGSQFRLAYTVMGDAVNLGSRLESLTKTYGVSILVSEFTREQATEYGYLELDCVRVKGKDLPVRIFEPQGLLGQLTMAQEALRSYLDQALAAYRRQDWAQARQAFAELAPRYPERAVLVDLYLQRIAHYSTEPPPPDWDGASTFATK
jgi:adenylate cyclase